MDVIIRYTYLYEFVDVESDWHFVEMSLNSMNSNIDPDCEHSLSVLAKGQ